MGSVDQVDKPILFFDGVCNLCNSSVQFIIRRDRNERFLFASLQSEKAKKTLPAKYRVEDDLKSLVLKDGDRLKTKSSAALTIARDLSGLWPFLYLLMIIPKALRDFVYDLIARNRYNWFGKKDACMIPTTDLKSRFVE